ncbi:hypothetical protein [Streptomyces sp. ODS28]|uniref:hypothetical protein n=1 Tax=Streptomyces sp. ODS28 TaxID=3136688 RepID=UPI0031F11268
MDDGGTDVDAVEGEFEGETADGLAIVAFVREEVRAREGAVQGGAGVFGGVRAAVYGEGVAAWGLLRHLGRRRVVVSVSPFPSPARRR